MSNLRVYQLASELGLKSKDLIQKLKEQGIEVSNHMASLDKETVELVKTVLYPKKEVPAAAAVVSPTVVKEESKEKKVETPVEVKPVEPVNKKVVPMEPPKVIVSAPEKPVEKIKPAEVPVKEEIQKKKIILSELVTVKQLSEKLNCSSGEIIKKLLENKIMANINQLIDLNVAKMIAGKFGFEVEEVSLEKEEKILEENKEVSGEMVTRAPVVTIMGHVDHGKTSLLDAIRKTNVTGKEAGGITQHIGAYDVELPKGKVVFLDTPGHEAFTAMRARGAKITDIVVLVVAADDGVMPQTVEAIDHARAANVPIVVAINKIDKPNANPEKIKQMLSDYNLVPEEWGGTTIYVPVSAKMGKGIEDLLEMILLQAEMLELKANPSTSAQGVIVEAKLDKGRGVVATVLVQKGTLKVGDVCVVGSYFGKVRALINSRGKKMMSVGPSTPIEMLGLSGLPSAGDLFVIVSDEKKARQISSLRLEKQREEKLFSGSKITLEDLHKQISEGKIHELNVVLKVDVQGSLQPLKEALEKLKSPQMSLRVIHAAVGGITDTDVLLASASNAILIGFNIRPSESIVKLAKKEEVDIRLYTIIYNVVSDIKSAMEGLLEPEFKEKVLGHAEVRKLFTVPKIGVIAGCYVTDGSIPRNAQIRLIRDNILVHEGKISSLKHFKDDIKEATLGFECGIGIEKFNDIKLGDTMEAFIMEKIAQKLA